MKTYKKESDFSYTTGAFASIEMIKTRPQQAQTIIVHSAYKDSEGLFALCQEKSIPIRQDDRLFKRLNQKENTYVLGLFSKYACRLSADAAHVVLVNPSDMGNLGTNIRTLAGFNFTNLAIITPAADHWHPKTIRASMGALFRIEIELFPSFEDYRERFDKHKIYPFMLDGEMLLTDNCPRGELYSLVFGNEATGLPESFNNHIGTSIRLPQSEMVDSLNLSVALGIATFLFASANGQIETAPLHGAF